MRCKKCGNFAISEDGLCAKCRANLSEESKPYDNPNNKTAGNKTAIGAVVGAVVAIICFVFAVYAISTGIVSVGKGDVPAGLDVPSLYVYSGYFFGIAGIVLAVYVPILSVRAIKTYKQIVAWGSKEKPVLTMVLGVVGAVLSLVVAVCAVAVTVFLAVKGAEFLQIVMFPSKV